MAGESQREAMLTAVMTRLSGDATLAALATGGVHLVRAPQDAVAPYVTVRMRPGGRIIQTLGLARAARIVNVEVVGVVKGAGTITAERIDERIDALLADHQLSVVAPWSVTGIRRLVDIDSSHIDDGAEFDQVGGLYRMWMTGGST